MATAPTKSLVGDDSARDNEPGQETLQNFSVKTSDQNSSWDRHGIMESTSISIEQNGEVQGDSAEFFGEHCFSRENSGIYSCCLYRDVSGEGLAFLSRESSCSKYFSTDIADAHTNAPHTDANTTSEISSPCKPESGSAAVNSYCTEGIFDWLENEDYGNHEPQDFEHNQCTEGTIFQGPPSTSVVQTKPTSLSLQPFPTARGMPHQRDNRRGAHVRDRPEMQRTARDGAVHWATQLRAVRAAWSARAFWSPAFLARYAGQVEAAQGRIKSKQECLLRFLQMSAADGLIAPAPFSAAGGGFFGWIRFAVVPGRAAEFRGAMEALFPAGFKEDTLKETFRRAGLIPERFQWELGFCGAVPFEFRARLR